jgi:murein DD-endopeptidase MepM/ murein hydrolase activator NlpD
MISPARKIIRNDSGGQGHYGASRGSRTHLGTDFAARAGQMVLAPLDMVIKRIAKPNASYLSGIAFYTPNSTGKMFYFEPDTSLIGEEVHQGQIIGIAQELQSHYGQNVGDHIHVQFDSFNPMIFIV